MHQPVFRACACAAGSMQARASTSRTSITAIANSIKSLAPKPIGLCSGRNERRTWNRYMDLFYSHKHFSPCIIAPGAQRLVIPGGSVDSRPQGFRWPVLIALAFGAILLGAGVLLFVSAY